MDSDKNSPSTTPEEARGEAELTENFLPEKSKIKYEKTYLEFKTWCQERNITKFSEPVLLSYFSDIVKRGLIGSLWPKYSMLKTTLQLNDNVDIGKYVKLISFIKEQKVGYVTKKSKVLEKEHVFKFLMAAPDEVYLMAKVALIFGISGALRKRELLNLETTDVQDMGSKFLVSIKDSKTNAKKRFAIIDYEGCTVLHLVRRYMSMRPRNTPHKRFFIFYRHNQCTVQPVGINSFSKMPSLIATYLKLDQPHLYTGHCFRRSSGAILSECGTSFDAFEELCNWNSAAAGAGPPESFLKNTNEVAKHLICETNVDSSITSTTNIAEVRYKNKQENATNAKTNDSAPTSEDPVTSEFVKVEVDSEISPAHDESAEEQNPNSQYSDSDVGEIEVQDAKSRWVNIRTSYVRSLNQNKGGKPYYLSKELEFLRPHVKSNRARPNNIHPLELESQNEEVSKEDNMVYVKMNSGDEVFIKDELPDDQVDMDMQEDPFGTYESYADEDSLNSTHDEDSQPSSKKEPSTPVIRILNSELGKQKRSSGNLRLEIKKKMQQVTRSVDITNLIENRNVECKTNSEEEDSPKASSVKTDNSESKSCLQPKQSDVDEARRLFLLSLFPEIQHLSNQKYSIFRMRVLEVLDDLSNFP